MSGRLRRSVSTLVVTAVAVAGAAFAPTPAVAQTGLLAPAGTCPGQDRADLPAADQARIMVCLINHARSRAGLGRLPASPVLTRAARTKTRLMLRCDDFSHEACGLPFDRVIRQAGYSGSSMAENIAWGNGHYATPRETMAGWLRSPGHKANILRRGWAVQGVAVSPGVSFQGYAGTSVWTSQFGA